ncbi:hypothetical protein [Oleiagrimonas sp. C23AA]|uniref:hypothetical protein n=1 Tax=Oleiagrimonas sp. C23AA TaxID=2719047 RepID=UPI001F0F5FEE|nr:hypothetical protein [Oleiagrimonas sp. C23AA]
MTARSQQIQARRQAPADTLGKAVLDFVGTVPRAHAPGEGSPAVQAKAIADAAAHRAALTAGSLSLPPGPLGWLTVLPELVAVWRIQAQMVADIAAVYGRQAALGREQMLYCLFRHTAAQAVRDLLVRAGDRLLFRRATVIGIERVARHIGLHLSRRAIGRGVSRWLPLIGAVGVGWYARYDTQQVAKTAITLFNDDDTEVQADMVEAVGEHPESPEAVTRLSADAG